MRSQRVRHTVTAALCAALLAGAALGQESPQPESAPAPGETPSSRPSSPAHATPAVREEEPAVYLLPDGQNGYKPVINFPLEKFKELLERERRAAGDNARPSPAVELSGEGTADGGRARLTLVFQVTVPDDGWVKVPLRMDEAVILSQRYSGPGEHVLVPADEVQGYVAWFRGRGNEPHRLTVTTVVPIERAAGESRFRLALPRLTTSELKLRIPHRDVVVRTPQGVELERLPDAKGDETLVRSLGSGNSLEFSWRVPSGSSHSAPAVISSQGALEVQADGRAATTTAQFTLTTSEGEIDRFQVLLPPKATLVTGRADGYSVTPVADASRGAERVRLEVVPLAEPAKQVVLKLVTEQSLPEPGTVQFVDLAGFDVLGARQQTGFLALRVVGDWQVVFGQRRNAREVPIGDLPTELRGTDLLAGFEYLAQPSELSVRVVPRRPRVAVEPQYVYTVTADSIELDARLRFTVRGARVFALQLEFPDETWEVTEVGPAGLVDLDGVLFEQLQPLSIPLLQPGNGELELTVRARRALEPGSGHVEFGLPRPLANTVGPAAVVIVNAENVELVPRVEQIQGMSRQASTSSPELAANLQDALFYRGDAGTARFWAEHRVLEQQVSARVVTQIHLDSTTPWAEQRLGFTVAHEPIERIALDCPRSLADGKDAEFFLDGQRVQPVADRESTPLQSGLQRLILPLSKPMIGVVNVRIRYTLPRQKLDPKISVPLDIPLLAPVDTKSSSHELTVFTSPGLEARLREGPWQAVDAAPGEATTRQQLHFRSAEPAYAVSLALSLEDPETFGATIVDRAWIQTWLGDARRRDRVALRLNSRQPILTLQLPEGAVTGTVGIRVDGRRASVSTSTGKTYAIPLSNRPDDPKESDKSSEANDQSPVKNGAEAAPLPADEHVVELEYEVLRSPKFDVALNPPQFTQPVRVNQTYWQIVLPRYQHVVARTGDYGSEFNWGWQGYYWGRQPLMEAFELESWSGARHEPALPGTTNRYLCGTLGSPQAMTIRIVPRWLIVLAASGTALVVGFGLIYVSALRHPAILGAAAIGIVAAGIAAPEPTLMVLQAAVLGALLTLVATALRRWLARPPIARPGSTLIHPGSSISRRRESDAVFRPAVTGSNSSTDSGPLAGQLTGPESKS